MKRRWTQALLVVGFCYAGLCLAVWHWQTSLILFPSSQLGDTPSQWGLPLEALEVVNADGIKLCGWLIPPARQQTNPVWILHCHGNGGNRSNCLSKARLFHEIGAGVVLFDYRGYGGNEGHANREEDLVADGQAFFNQLKKRPGRIVLYGESLGGGVACDLALRQPCAGLILQSTFSTFTTRASETVPFLPVRWLCRYGFDNLAAVAQLECPKLIMHSPQDKVTGYDHGRQLLEAARPPCEWGELSGAHNDPAPISLAQPVKKFLASLPP